ncbi:DUF885 domain-containing protein [Aeromicrobium sp.]|uniref:DUF885 domain-containing protein n=1 Tax=Aeromicrobium sp. TaxID=1871063 RepID=UPI0025BC7895|nr:DUF885 domain-containing protein [Aeromicrobium sp.]MCK5892001.1 DUF885 domain-containing protein [Aeromicrobium sp.]
MNREPTPMDRVAESWLDTLLELQPEWHVELGRPGREGEYADHSPDGHAALAAAAAATLRTVRETEPVDEVDRVTRLELERTLELTEEQFASGEWRRDLNVIASPAQSLREIFDLVPTTTDDDWHHVARRLRNVPAAVDGYVATLTDGIQHGQTPALRQVREVLTQTRELAGPGSFFLGLAEQGPDGQQQELQAAAADAAAGYARLSEFLAHTLAPAARQQDAVGREAYALASRSFVGLEVDLDETYAWGVEELRRMVTEQEEVAREIVPGGSVAEAIAALDADPSRILHGTDALQAWMQDTSDAAIAALDGVHVDIDPRLRALECRIAPTQTGGIYYTPPSEDFARAGRMWWSVPPGVTEFGTWRERTTVYHEGVPGHHLQCGIAVAAAATLNGWRRISWNSGHGEGWALYAERLMADLGFLDDPGDRLGMLDAQRQRAARVVVDIGVHLGLPKPDGSGPWRGDDVLPFMRQHMHMDEGFVRFEANRYLGWAGQAPSYKIGEREWTRLRDDWAAARGADLRRFHADALALGGVGLGTLRTTLLP